MHMMDIQVPQTISAALNEVPKQKICNKDFFVIKLFKLLKLLQVWSDSLLSVLFLHLHNNVSPGYNILLYIQQYARYTQTRQINVKYIIVGKKMTLMW